MIWKFSPTESPEILWIHNGCRKNLALPYTIGCCTSTWSRVKITPCLNCWLFGFCIFVFWKVYHCSFCIRTKEIDSYSSFNLCCIWTIRSNMFFLSSFCFQYFGVGFFKGNSQNFLPKTPPNRGHWLYRVSGRWPGESCEQRGSEPSRGRGWFISTMKKMHGYDIT